MSRLEKLLVVAVLLAAYALASTVDAQGAALLALPWRLIRHLAWWARFQVDPWGAGR